MVNDVRMGEHREPVLQDVAEIARLVDALYHIDCTSGWSRRPAGRRPRWSTHRGGAEQHHEGRGHRGDSWRGGAQGHRDGDRHRRRRGCIARESDRRLRGLPSQPLKRPQGRHRGDRRVRAPRAAVRLPSMAMAGGSSPVTLIGTFVQHNAEVSPGSPCRSSRRAARRSTTARRRPPWTFAWRPPASARRSSPSSAPPRPRSARRYLIPASWPGCRRTRSSVTPRPVTRRRSRA